MTAEVIQFNEPKPEPRVKGKCSFCGKSEDNAGRLFGNSQPGKYARWVCDACIRKCKALISEPAKEVS
jgi:hypothetical protein